jgi:hypothetical protein
VLQCLPHLQVSRQYCRMACVHAETAQVGRGEAWGSKTPQGHPVAAAWCGRVQSADQVVCNAQGSCLHQGYAMPRATAVIEDAPLNHP